MTTLRSALSGIIALSSTLTFAAADPFIGTSGSGHVVPAAVYPFGGVQPGPDTAAQPTFYGHDVPHCCGYQFTDHYLYRFSQTHLIGVGCLSCGDIGLLPYVAEPTNGVYMATMDKATERAEPGYYAVSLADSRIACEISARAHSAAYRFRYGRTDCPAKLLLDLDHGIGAPTRGKPTDRWYWSFRRIDESRVRAVSPTRLVGTLRGMSWTDFQVFFAIDFSAPVVTSSVVRTAGNGHGTVVALDFGSLGERPLEAKLALSITSEAAAAANLDAEMPRFDFDGVRRDAAAAWSDYLGRLTLADGTPDAIRKSFEAALYRTALQPNDLGDVGKPFYSTFSLWDTFRATHPLYTLVAPERVDGFVSSLLATYRKNGYLPIWGLWGTDNHCMIGHHAVPVIVDAYLKGFRGFDLDLAYEAVTNSLTVEHTAAVTGQWGLLKEDWKVLDTYGYIPFDAMSGTPYMPSVTGESASRTLEGAYDDACAERFAAARGDTKTADFFRRRSFAWTNLYDRTTGVIRGRNRKGEWREPFDPYAFGWCVWGDNDFTEGNTYQYTWHVMQHPDEFVAILGGPKAAGERLDAIFTLDPVVQGNCADLAGKLLGQYVHANEPSHHIAYFYAWTDRPQRTAEIVRKVFDTQYSPEPDGLSGNDDCGQMAAWYVFSALGFYPFDPCGGDYVLGAPQVPGATLKLPNGRTFRVTVRNFSRENLHVKSAKLNGQPLERVITHAQILAGGELVFEMAP